MSITRAYDEIVEFIAAGNDSRSVSEFTPSDEAKARVHNLIQRSKEGSLTDDEASELQNYLQIEHIMRLAKARAKHYVSASQAV